jgi:hypothetical protein
MSFVNFTKIHLQGNDDILFLINHYYMIEKKNKNKSFPIQSQIN